MPGDMETGDIMEGGRNPDTGEKMVNLPTSNNDVLGADDLVVAEKMVNMDSTMVDIGTGSDMTKEGTELDMVASGREEIAGEKKKPGRYVNAGGEKVGGRNLTGKDRFARGDPCFAKVRGYCPWPAMIMERSSKVKKEKYTVEFYGTAERNVVDVGSIWPVTKELVEKFVTVKTLKQEIFKVGFEEMKTKHSLFEAEVETSDDEYDFEFRHTKVARESLLDVSTEEVFTDSDDDDDRDSQPKQAGNVVVTEQDSGTSALCSAEGESEVDLDGEEKDDMNKTWDCEECGESFTNDSDKKRHLSYHVANKMLNGKSKPRAEKKAKEACVKNTVGKKTATKKKGKTLKEDELELNAAFAEKILILGDGSFSCKNCPDFATNVRLLARTHAKSCGTKKKSGRKAKQIFCTECGIPCLGKDSLAKHFRTCHVVSSYTCSKCFKSFKSRNTYMKHLRIHETIKKEIKCPHCPKTFKFESYKNRHIIRVHATALKVTQRLWEAIDDAGDDDLTVEVNMEESKGENSSWQYQAHFPGSGKQKMRSSESFYNTIGLNTKQEWDEWIEISKALGVSPSIDGSLDTIELAMVTDALGGVHIDCAGADEQSLFTRSVTLDESSGGLDDLRMPVGNMYVESADKPTVDEAEELMDDGKEGSASAGMADYVDLSLPAEWSSGDCVYAGGSGGEGAHGAGEGLVVVPGIQREKAEEIKCPHCDEVGFKDSWFLKRHIERMHLENIKCQICDTVFVDKYSFLIHYKNCYYFCSAPGCNYFEKRKSRFDGHMRKHAREDALA